MGSLPKEEDPFWEPPEDVLIGTASVFLQSLSFALDFDDKLSITDYKVGRKTPVVCSVSFLSFYSGLLTISVSGFREVGYWRRPFKRFPFIEKFREFRLGCEWNTTFVGRSSWRFPRISGTFESLSSVLVGNISSGNAFSICVLWQWLTSSLLFTTNFNESGERMELVICVKRNTFFVHCLSTFLKVFG